VEISMYSVSDPKGTLELLRALILHTMNFWDIPCSLSKTFGSLGSVFLERYAYYERHYGIDMYKEQLTVKAYAQSCVTKFPWKAKMYFAAAEQWTKSEYARDRCIDTCPIEFDYDELSAPLWSGGWYICMENKVDMALTKCSDRQLRMGAQFQKWVTPYVTTRWEKGSSYIDIQNTIEKNVHNAYSEELARVTFEAVDRLEDINFDLDETGHATDVALLLYKGRDDKFPLQIAHLLRTMPIERGAVT
jgi:hypothetical protein